MFLLPNAVSARGEQIAQGWAASLAMGAGQFCTKPGLAVVVDGSSFEHFVLETKAALQQIGAQMMLTEAMADAFRWGCHRISANKGVRAVLTSACSEREATPALFEVSGEDWLANQALGEEVFGPLGLVIRVRDIAEIVTIARCLQGQLTCTLHFDAADTELACSLLPILERKAGRLLANGFPTSVEVCDAMVHGGPYPASTNFGAPSVGTLSIRRWLRPVCYQNMPEEVLPVDFRQSIG